MTVTHIVGIDPGLVHTGVVSLKFNPEDMEVLVGHAASNGSNLQDLSNHLATFGPAEEIFIEAYRPRSSFGTDQRMVTLVSEVRAMTQGQVVQNTGVVKVVRPKLMKLLGVWDFSTRTHHQDLRSAARIALLGMMRDPDLNTLLTRAVSDHLEGSTWDVVLT